MAYSTYKPTVALVLLSLLGSIAFAAPGGKKGKPGDDEGANCAADALFPALIYQVGSAAGDGTHELVVASSDGCVELTVEQSIQFGGVRLKYDETSGSGYYAWSENVFPAGFPGNIRRQDFAVIDGVLTPTSSGDLYEGVGRLDLFDLQGDSLAVVDVLAGERTLLVIDLSACDLGFPCDENDAASVYRPSLNCLPDGNGGCFQPGFGVSMTSDGSAIYFDVPNGGIARVTRGAEGWAAQTPERFLRDDNYSEAHVLGLSRNSQYLAVGYLAGFQKGGLRDNRVIILNTDTTGLATDLIQDFSTWTATWTVDDTLYVLGTEGKRRKMRHPIEELDPVTGVRLPLGIVLDDHPRLDSSL